MGNNKKVFSNRRRKEEGPPYLQIEMADKMNQASKNNARYRSIKLEDLGKTTPTPTGYHQRNGAVYRSIAVSQPKAGGIMSTTGLFPSTSPLMTSGHVKAVTKPAGNPGEVIKSLLKVQPYCFPRSNKCLELKKDADFCEMLRVIAGCLPGKCSVNEDSFKIKAFLNECTEVKIYIFQTENNQVFVEFDRYSGCPFLFNKFYHQIVLAVSEYVRLPVDVNDHKRKFDNFCRREEKVENLGPLPPFGVV